MCSILIYGLAINFTHKRYACAFTPGLNKLCAGGVRRRGCDANTAPKWQLMQRKENLQVLKTIWSPT